MKKNLSLLMVALILCYHSTANAQPDPGTFSITPKVGVNGSMLSGDPAIEITLVKIPDSYLSNEFFSWQENVQPEDMLQVISSRFCSKSLHFGWNGGIEAAYQLSARWALTGSLEYSLQGNSYDDITFPAYSNREEMSFSGTRLSMHYLNMPVLARYYFLPNFAFELGIQPGWCFKNVVKSDVTFDKVKTTLDDESDVFSDFDISCPVGLTYQIGRYSIGARYNIGITNVFAEKWSSYPSSEKSNARNSVFQLTLGYRFDL